MGTPLPKHFPITSQKEMMMMMITYKDMNDNGVISDFNTQTGSDCSSEAGSAGFVRQVFVSSD